MLGIFMNKSFLNCWEKIDSECSIAWFCETYEIASQRHLLQIKYWLFIIQLKAHSFVLKNMNKTTLLSILMCTNHSCNNPRILWKGDRYSSQCH